MLKQLSLIGYQLLFDFCLAVLFWHFEIGLILLKEGSIYI